jgi:hypothetical protein
MRFVVFGISFCFFSSVCAADEFTHPLAARTLIHLGADFVNRVPITSNAIDNWSAAGKLDSPKRSRLVIHLFNRGLEVPFTDKGDIATRFRLRPNGESSVSVIFRYD